VLERFIASPCARSGASICINRSRGIGAI
jgi:hypothetical protein